MTRKNYIKTSSNPIFGTLFIQLFYKESLLKSVSKMVTYKFNQSLAKKFMNLSIRGGKTSLTYVWIDGSGQSCRSKTKTVDDEKAEKLMDYYQVDEISYSKNKKESLIWDFCASGAGFKEAEEAKKAKEAEASNNEKISVHSSCELRPCAVYDDPFHQGNAKLVLCEVYYDGKPVKTNNRKECLDALNGKVEPIVTQQNSYVTAQIINKNEIFKPMFGIEQEYTLIDPKTNRPLGWPESGFPAPQGPYYCGVGTGLAIGRDIAEAHYRACLHANIAIYGYNAEVMPGQWEFQIGECEGIKVGDDLWMARFILVRVAEEFGVKVSFDPKPVEGDWNGSGAHINFSNAHTRCENGLNVIHKMIESLGNHHAEAIAVYDPNGGKDNARRLTGEHETSNIDVFTHNCDDRGASIRIPRRVKEDKYGYFEDRRPASNCDPYKVITHLVKICCNYF